MSGGRNTGVYWCYVAVVLENGNYYSGLYRDYIRVILGLYWDNGKENVNYYNGLYRDYIRVKESKASACRPKKHSRGPMIFTSVGLERPT